MLFTRVSHIRIIALLVAVFAWTAPTARAQDAESADAAEDQPTTPTIDVISLRPILRAEPETVRLEPVFRVPEPLPGKNGSTAAGDRGTSDTKTSNATPHEKGKLPRTATRPPRTSSAASQSSSSPTSGDSRASDRLARALGLLDKGRVAEARKLLLNLAEEFPRSPQAPEAIFLAAETLRDLEQARRELRRVVLEYPRSPHVPNALSRIGEISFILGDHEECVRAYRAFLKYESDPVGLRQAGIQLAFALLRSGDFEQAREVFVRLRAEHADLAEAPEMIEGEADALLALGLLDQAEPLYERLETDFPNYPFAVKVLLSRAICAELQGRRDEARRYYKTVVDDYPQSIEAPLASSRLDDIEYALVPGARASLTRP